MPSPVVLERGEGEVGKLTRSGLGPVGFVCNLPSVLVRPEVVSEKLEKEVALGCMSGPFASVPLARLHVSLPGLVPKQDPGHHLSYPARASVIDGIDLEVSRWSTPPLMRRCPSLGRNGPVALVAKTDVESAFRGY